MKELDNIDREFQVYDHLQKEKEAIKQRARRVLAEQERRYASEVSQFKQHKQKQEGRERS